VQEREILAVCISVADHHVQCYGPQEFVKIVLRSDCLQYAGNPAH